jgi:predicted ATPase
LAQRDLIGSLIPGGDLPASLLERLIRESGGNPFYLEEAARGLIQSEQLVRQDGKWHLTRSIDQVYIPHSIEGQVMAHLDILDESSRLALQHASVIGMTFKRQLLAAITPISNIDAALENLAQRALITRTTGNNEADPGYTFAQMVVREVAYRSLLRKTRRELHDKITTLTDEGKDAVNFDFDVESVEALARHYMAGGNEEKIAIYNWLVGLRAMDRFNFEEACKHLEIAHNALLEIETPDHETYLNVLYLLGDASTFTGKFTQAATCYQAVWEMIKHDPKELATLYYRIGRLNTYQGNLESAHTSYQYAAQLAQDQPELLAQLDAEIRLLYDWS